MTPKDDSTNGTNEDNPDDKPDTSDSAGGDDGSAATSGDLATTIRTIVKEELSKAKDLFTGGAKPEGKVDDKPPAEGGSLRAIEKRAEELVRNALTNVVKEQEHEHDHQALRNKQPVSEAAPKTVRKLTKALWGSDDE